MKATVKLYVTDGETAAGFPIKLIISHKKKHRRKILTHSSLIDWDSGLQLPRSTHVDFDSLYPEILNMRAKAAKMDFRKLEDFDQAFEMLQDAPRKLAGTNFFTWGNRCVKLLQDQNKDGNAQSYRNSLDALARFEPQLNFEELTPYLLENFKNFCKARGNGNKTIKHYGGALKAIYNRAIRARVAKDLQPFKDFSRDIPTRDRRKKNRYLDLASIRILETANLPDAQRRDLDLALLQFYLGGVDLIDIYFLKNSQFARNRVFFERGKMSDIAFEFDLLVPEPAKRIIEKYGGPGEYVFPWRKDRLGYNTFMNNGRRNLLKVQKLLKIELHPKNENFTFKVMRHSFATLGKYHGIHEDMLREMMGHERSDIDTAYKAKFKEAERDAAQLKILGVFEEKKIRKVAVKTKVKRG